MTDSTMNKCFGYEKVDVVSKNKPKEKTGWTVKSVIKTLVYSTIVAFVCAYAIEFYYNTYMVHPWWQFWK